jgi:hypothetical protein
MRTFSEWVKAANMREAAGGGGVGAAPVNCVGNGQIAGLGVGPEGMPPGPAPVGDIGGIIHRRKPKKPLPSPVDPGQSYGEPA